MRFVKDESGQALVMTAVSMSLLMGFLALAVDVGMLFRERRQMQIAADAAAAAAALDFKYNNVASSARTAGKSSALANGVTNTSYVTINTPPVNGPYASVSGYAEAIVQQPTSTYFMRLFRFDSITVAARAVAGTGVNVRANGGCIWTLGSSGSGVLLSGTGSITAQNCNIYDNSNASNALELTGTGSISAKAIGIVGGSRDTGTGSITPSNPTTGIAPAANPLALPTPTIPTGTCSSNCTPNNGGTGNMTLNPGTYTSITNSGTGNLTLTPGNYIITGDLKNNGTGQMILGNGNYTIGGNFTSSGTSSLTLGSGFYIVEGDLGLTGTGVLTGSRVTFYTEGSTAVSGTGGMSLTAPTTGTYSGVLFYQPSSNSHAMSLSGTGGATIQGIIDAPKAPLTLSGTGSLSVSLDLIVNSLTVSGTGTVTNTDYSSVTNTSSVLSKIVMVE